MRRKILIVDDSLFIRNILKDILSKEYDLCEADSGTSAIMEYAREQPDLVLLDIIMPDGTLEGVHVLKKIRERNESAMVIMITAIGQDEIIEKCKKIGAIDYIVKPFEEQEIIKTIKKHMEQ